MGPATRFPRRPISVNTSSKQVIDELMRHLRKAEDMAKMGWRRARELSMLRASGYIMRPETRR